MVEYSAVVLFSGGVDSYTLLNMARRTFPVVHAITFLYGQKNYKEVNYATRYCEREGITQKVVEVTSPMRQLMGGATSLLDVTQKVPDADDTEEERATITVPARNLIFLSLAVGYATAHQLGHVWYGPLKGDVSPDCKPAFVNAVREAASEASGYNVLIAAPFLETDKVQVLQLGKVWELNYADTWTCYNGRDKACGTCMACKRRKEAFALADMIDPTEYEDANY